jgi:hypothetical protein
MTTAFCATIPAELVPDARRLSWAIGEAAGPNDDWYIPLGPDGGEVTHYGLDALSVGPGFAEMLAGAGSGDLPAIDWTAYGLTEQRVAAVVAALWSSFYDPASGSQADALWQSRGLSRVQEAAP